MVCVVLWLNLKARAQEHEFAMRRLFWSLYRERERERVSDICERESERREREEREER